MHEVSKSNHLVCFSIQNYIFICTFANNINLNEKKPSEVNSPVFLFTIQAVLVDYIETCLCPQALVQILLLILLGITTYTTFTGTQIGVRAKQVITNIVCSERNRRVSLWKKNLIS